jgi:transglutaminase-like putative cysteine protease
MRLGISHTTRYGFSGPVSQGLQRLRLTPLRLAGQTVASWSLDLEGARHEAGYTDAYGNRVDLISFLPGVEAVTIHAHGVVDTRDNAGVIGTAQGMLPLWHFTEQTALTEGGAAMAALLDGLGGGEDDVLSRLHALAGLVREAVAYEPGHTDVATTAEAVLEAGRGVCQDQAHVFIGAARSLGIPARYASGYLMMDETIEQEASHAWAEAHVPGLGWVGFDIANAICPDARYVHLATGADYTACAPITGLHQGALDEAMHVSLAVEQQRVEQ